MAVRESNRDCRFFMKPRHALAFGIIVTTAFAAEDSAKVTPEKVLEAYKTFTRVTKEPKSIGAEFAGLCNVPPSIVQAAKETGPHVSHYLHYYINETAKHHRDGGGKGDYPAGSVIVKEKLLAGGLFPSRNLDQIGAVVGMIKREPGSNRRTHDWEFFYFSPQNESRDKKPTAWRKEKDVASCAGCHSSEPDMVFGRFNEPYKIPTPGKSEKSIRLEVTPADNSPLGPR